MTDQELLEAMRSMMKAELEPINGRLDKVEQNLDKLEKNQNSMQDHISSLASDVSHMNHHIEPKLDKVLEMVSAANERNRRVDVLEDRVDDHDHRIFAVEQELKKA